MVTAMQQLRKEMREEAKAAEALDPATPETLAHAEKLGRQGCLLGKQAPAQDAKIIDMCLNRPHNTRIKLMKAWNKGWNTEYQIQTDKELEKIGIITPRMEAASKKG